jgi:hypothetical protein
MTVLPQPAGHSLPCKFTPVFEDYLWEHLTELFGFIPLQRCSPLPKPFQDILALDGDRLVVIIVKPTEDHWVVYQATAYHQYLLQERPYSDRVNYNQPVRMMVISPRFQDKTLVHRPQNAIAMEFWTVEGDDRDKPYRWELTLHDSLITHRITHRITLTKRQLLAECHPTPALPPKTQKLQQLLSQVSPAEQEKVECIRQYLLRTNQSFTEFTYGDSVRIGLGKSWPCFEVAFDKARNSLALFLWLPFKERYGDVQEKRSMARVRIWTDGQRVTDIGYSPEGLGHKVTFAEFRAAAVRPLRRSLGNRSYNRYYKDPTWRKQVADEQEARYNRHPWSGSQYEYALTLLQYEKLIHQRFPDPTVITFVKLSMESIIVRKI